MVAWKLILILQLQTAFGVELEAIALGETPMPYEACMAVQPLVRQKLEAFEFGSDMGQREVTMLCVPWPTKPPGDFK